MFYPLCSYIFKSFWDKGYIFSKVLGLGISSYLVWILVSFKLMDFSFLTIVMALSLLGFVNWWGWFGRKKKEKINWRIIIINEMVFFILLAIWSYIRGFEPNIIGLEKFMDYGFVNAILKSDFFPAKDMWLAGDNSINYYYFGHYVCAFLTKFSGVKSEVTYNLQIGALFGLNGVAVFSLVSNILHAKYIKIDGKVLFGALIGSLLFNIGGNFHTVVLLFKRGLTSYWYPDATRFIPYTIHEFPLYSYVVADLHGHLSDIPFVLLSIGLIFCFYLSLRKIKGDFLWKMWEKREKKNILYPVVVLFLIGFNLAINYMTNAWDLPIYMTLVGLGFLAGRWKEIGFNWKLIRETAIFVFLILGTYLFFVIPFNLYFEPFFKGVDFVQARSPFWMLLVLWGYFYFFGISFLILIYGKRIKRLFNRKKVVEFLARVLDVRTTIKEKRIKIEEVDEVDVFVVLMIGLSTFLIVFPEVGYIKDIYIKEYHRANTMFKLTYQSFMMLSMIAGYTISSFMKKSASVKRDVWSYLALVVVCCALVYPYFAVRSYYNSLRDYKGLDGIIYLDSKYPGDYEAVMWLRENVGGDEVVLEAVGESYTDYGRISSYTGLQTVLGWPVHEWLWRGSYDEAGKRTGEVEKIYMGGVEEVRGLLNRYGVDYVVLGKLERDKYENINEDNFRKLGEVVFDKGETKIYRIN